MASETRDPRHVVCLIEGGVEGRVVVDLEALLQFSNWIDRKLLQLEERWPAATGRWPGLGRKLAGSAEEFLES